MNVKPQTLMVAIQCVSSEIHKLDRRLKARSVEDPAEWLQITYAGQPLVKNMAHQRHNIRRPR